MQHRDEHARLSTLQGVIDEKTASAYLCLSRSWLRQSRMRGAGPVYLKVGRAVRYRLVDLDEWLARHRVCPAA